jgi:NTP pyrophosphatase (non-canonical NTP hydrolase)
MEDNELLPEKEDMEYWLKQLRNFVVYYIKNRPLVMPDFSDAMKFVTTEIGEVYEVDLSRKLWIRNNPESKPEFSKEKLSEELGDVIMMLIVAGIAEDVNPLTSLYNKMCRKLGMNNE